MNNCFLKVRKYLLRVKCVDTTEKKQQQQQQQQLGVGDDRSSSATDRLTDDGVYRREAK